MHFLEMMTLIAEIFAPLFLIGGLWGIYKEKDISLGFGAELWASMCCFFLILVSNYC